MTLNLLFVGFGVSAFLYVSRLLFARKWININNYPDLNAKMLNGKTFIITGGNTGLGKSVALDLAKRGADEVIIACRNTSQGKQVAQINTECTGNTNIKCMLLDLASLESIKTFVKNFAMDHSKLDCLICNAGIWAPMEKGLKTADGYEMHFGVNHLGHYLLVKLLSNALHNSNNSRIVVVSSSLMSSGVVDMDNIDVFNGRQSDPSDIKRPSYAPRGYCDSKLMNGLFVKELASCDNQITSVAVCPGWCKTDLSRHVNIPLYKKLLFLPFMFMFMRTCAQGSNNIIFCAIQDIDKMHNGGFYRDGTLQIKENNRLDALTQKGVSQKLWELSEKICSAPNY
jgi:NAD(P)-dependent dehydrogenase (short-subunit alcohol dehydrogenase family)